MSGISRYSNCDLLQLPNCDGLLENGKCRWLDVPACIGEDCHRCQKQDSLSQARARLCSLDEDTQERIARKYYGGTRPWKSIILSSRR